MPDDIEIELRAIKTMLEVLEPLTPSVRSSVTEYVFKRLGISLPQIQLPLTSGLGEFVAVESLSRPDDPNDILSLKEQKKPTTGTQMVAVVAYYLAHLAPARERQDFITTNEIQKYFVQGKYPLPGSQSQALVDAKNAGYVDFVEKGKYRLNSVGYNLVAHKLPKDSLAPAKASSKHRRKSNKSIAKKSSRKAKK